MSTITIPFAALNLPRENKAIITYARVVHDRLDGNASFPSPSPTLTVFAADIDAFDEAETKATLRTKGAVQERNVKKRKVKEDLTNLRNYVQSVVELPANHRSAAALIESAFMSVRKTGKASKAELSARNGRVSGSVVLEAKAVARQATYYWQYSLDQHSWISVPETMQASRTIEGLTPAKMYFFRFRALTRAGETDFSQVVSLIVH